MMNKRQFLKAGAAAGVAAGGMGAFQQLSALAQSATPPDYRALVCLFMYGGNDGNNLLVPYEAADYNRYATSRSNLALNKDALQLIRPSNTQSIRYGLHPAMGGLAGLFNGTATQSPKAALVANVGPLLVPTTKAQWDARSVPLPDNLFSHSDQQSQWQAAVYERPSNGWGGRLVERLVDPAATNRGYSVLSVTGGNLWEAGDVSLTPYKVSPSGRFGFDFYSPQGNDPLSAAISETLADVNQHVMEQGFVDVMGRSIEVQRILTQALQGTSVTTVFPDTGIGNQLRMVARLIGAH